MNPLLKTLLELQSFDSELHFLKELGRKRPLELEKDRDRLRGAQQAVQAIQERSKALRMECDRGELDIRKNQAETEKLQIALNTARTNQEYQILKDQMGRLAEKTGEIEERILDKLGSVDVLGAEKQSAEAHVEQLAKELSLKEAEMRAFLGELEKKVQDLEARRLAKRKEVPAESLDLYEKVITRYRDSAMALVENKVCQGCHMSVTTQAVSELLMGKELVQCKNCLRILYLR